MSIPTGVLPIAHIVYFLEWEILKWIFEFLISGLPCLPKDINGISVIPYSLLRPYSRSISPAREENNKLQTCMIVGGVDVPKGVSSNNKYG